MENTLYNNILDDYIKIDEVQVKLEKEQMELFEKYVKEQEKYKNHSKEQILAENEYDRLLNKKHWVEEDGRKIQEANRLKKIEEKKVLDEYERLRKIKK